MKKLTLFLLLLNTMVLSILAIPLNIRVLFKEVVKNPAMRHSLKQFDKRREKIFKTTFTETMRVWRRIRGAVVDGDDDDTDDSTGAFVKNIAKDNQQAFALLSELIISKSGWKHIGTKDGVIVERKFLGAGPFVSKEDAEKGSKHACVRSSGIINRPPEYVFHLFQDNSLVSQYNEHVTLMKDLQTFPQSHHSGKSKLTWCRGPSYGPFKARDFLSVVNYRKYGNGGYLILNRPGYHSKYKPSSNFVRGTILLAGSIIEPVEGSSGQQTKFTQIAHVNPGGGADTPAVAWMINKLSAIGPPAFLRKLEKCAFDLQSRGVTPLRL